VRAAEGLPGRLLCCAQELPDWLWPKLAELVNPVTQATVKIERVSSFPLPERAG
jgi:hypothetical protein